MKVSKYLTIMSKIDTDRATDEKIKNKLLYNYHEQEAFKPAKSIKHVDYRRRGNVIFHTFSKGLFIKQALPSFAFLAFIVVAIIGVKASFTGEREILPGAALDGARQTDATTNEMSVENEPITSSGEESQISMATENTVDTTAPLPIDTETVTEVTDTEDLVSDILKNAMASSTDSDYNVDSVPTDVVSNTADNQVIIADKLIESLNNAGLNTNDFYFAWFDVTAENSVKTSIPNLIVRLHGTVDSINPLDLSDIVLTRNGVPITNDIVLTDQVNQFNWRYEDVTDFYFAFDEVLKEPGIYALTGKYKGEPFEVYSKILESGVTDEPANANDLSYVTFLGYVNENNYMIELSEIVFGFNGVQNAFHISDLTDLTITRNNELIEFDVLDTVNRYYEAKSENSGDTSFNLILSQPLTEPGDYVISGVYQGVPFRSSITTIW